MRLSVFFQTQSDRRCMKDSRLNDRIWEAATAATGHYPTLAIGGFADLKRKLRPSPETSLTVPMGEALGISGKCYLLVLGLATSSSRSMGVGDNNIRAVYGIC